MGVDWRFFFFFCISRVTTLIFFPTKRLNTTKQQQYKYWSHLQFTFFNVSLDCHYCTLPMLDRRWNLWPLLLALWHHNPKCFFRNNHLLYFFELPNNTKKTVERVIYGQLQLDIQNAQLTFNMDPNQKCYVYNKKNFFGY